MRDAGKYGSLVLRPYHLFGRCWSSTEPQHLNFKARPDTLTITTTCQSLPSHQQRVLVRRDGSGLASYYRYNERRTARTAPEESTCSEFLVDVRTAIKCKISSSCLLLSELAVELPHSRRCNRKSFLSGISLSLREGSSILCCKTLVHVDFYLRNGDVSAQLPSHLAIVERKSLESQRTKLTFSLLFRFIMI
jgi:hypothetical protein